MVTTFKNIHIENCGTGVSMPSDARVQFDGLTIISCEKALELRDPPSILSSLGLPNHTPINLLIDVLSEIQSKNNLPIKEKEAVLQSSALFNWLGAAGNLSSVCGLILDAQQNGFVSQILNIFNK